MIGATLVRYLALRFFATIMLVFLIIFGMVYIVDFIETLRRVSDRPGITVGFVALLSFLRTPSVTEQILPFCVLFGTMITFIDLTQKLELIVVRAAGVSVWQFLLPPVGIALTIGVLSILVLNPMSAQMKQRADRMEEYIFGRTGQSASDASLWIRQTSMDGQAFLHAKTAADGDTELTGVNAYIYDRNGRFEAKVKADSGRLLPGVWRLKNALVSTPSQDALRVGTYLIASNDTPDHLAETFLTPEAVPFWSLSRLRQETDRSGLDSTGYSLQFQSLLARPLLLIAMVLIAAAFSLRFFRFGGIGRMVGGGLGAGFVLYLLTKMVADLGASGQLSVSVAAWSPAIVGSMLGALALLQREDG
ncbi:MAG TPA: LPS export ABC transporter permease LptG [Methylovirgula sp.]